MRVCLPFVGVGKLQVRRVLTHENIRLQGNLNSTRVLDQLAHRYHVLAKVVAQQRRLRRIRRLQIDHSTGAFDNLPGE